HVPAALLINPLAYARALGAAAVQAGARIFEHTPAIAADLAGIRKRIDTPRARVRANHVVLAGNVHLGTIVPSLAGTLVPVTGYVGVTRPLGKPLAHAIAFRGAVNSSRRAGDHYRVVNGDRLLWSGTVAGAIWARKSLAQVISSTYPQLGPVLFEHFWPVQTGFAVHGMPQIGEVQRGVWLASAFGGQGLNTSAMAGDLVARAIVEGDDAWKRFLPFELVGAGGAAGRTVARTAAWWQRRSEDVLAFAARQREEFQRSKEEQKSRAKSAEIKPADVKSPAGESPDGKSASAGIKLPGLKLAGAGFRNLKLAIPSARDAVPVLKRVLKGSPAADDRPIDAPEAVPAADEAKRDPGSGIEG
ncbi:MAG: FAD-binding oxidoreductase, partial [Bradyrhizobiaceae bacterium]|nr:FAD-binding oxidoreductase [Bradyrhizobiaceae bacterium]